MDMAKHAARVSFGSEVILESKAVDVPTDGDSHRRTSHIDQDIRYVSKFNLSSRVDASLGV